MTLSFRRSRRLFIVTSLLASLTTLAVTASPQPPPPPSRPPSPASLLINAEIMVLRAANQPGPGSIDPAIGNLPQLRSPPLSAYNTYQLMNRRILQLPAGNSGTYSLPNGRVLQVTFVGPTSEHGFKVKTAINQPGGNAYLKLLELTAKPNDPFFIAGQTFQGGNLVLVITLRP